MEIEENHTSMEVEEEKDEVAQFKAEREVQSLRAQLLDQPNAYQLHIKLISALREMGEGEEVEKAREAFSKLFPLTENMWLEWIADIKSEMKEKGEEEQKKVIQVYERAVKDYLSEHCFFQFFLIVFFF